MLKTSKILIPVDVMSNKFNHKLRGNVLNCTGSHVYTDHSFQVTSMREIT